MGNNGDGTNEKASIGTCPNCNRPAIKRGKVIDCEHCDASFRWTPEGSKVKSIGKIDEHEDRIKALEEKAGFNSTVQPLPADQDQDQEVEDDL